jgi:hypothetical protein
MMIGSRTTIIRNHRHSPAIHSEVDPKLRLTGGDGRGFTNDSRGSLDNILGGAGGSDFRVLSSFARDE